MVLCFIALQFCIHKYWKTIIQKDTEHTAMPHHTNPLLERVEKNKGKKMISKKMRRMKIKEKSFPFSCLDEKKTRRKEKKKKMFLFVCLNKK